MKIIISSTVSFLVGIFSSSIYLSDEIDKLNIEIKKMVGMTVAYSEKLDEQRVVDKLENQISTLEYIVAREQKGTPFSVLALDMASSTKTRIEDISADINSFEDEKLKNRVKELIEEGKKVVDDIEFFYK